MALDCARAPRGEKGNGTPGLRKVTSEKATKHRLGVKASGVLTGTHFTQTPMEIEV